MAARKKSAKSVATAVNDVMENFDRACLVAISAGIRLGELEAMLRSSFARSEKVRTKQETLPSIEK